jgi:hypothetical protein
MAAIVANAVIPAVVLSYPAFIASLKDLDDSSNPIYAKANDAVKPPIVCSPSLIC